MWHTIEDAKNNICPFRHDNDLFARDKYCCANKCMAWKYADFTRDIDGEQVNLGRCGLIA